MLPVVADTFILNENNNPNPSISYGDVPNLNLGQPGFDGKKSRILIRFSASDASKIASKIVSVGLNLTRLSGEDENGICNGKCPFQEGTVQAYALRNGWDEKSLVDPLGYGGARWHKREAGNLVGAKWGLPGADKAGEDRSSDSIGFENIKLNPDGNYIIPLQPQAFFAGVSPGSLDKDRSVLLVPDEKLITYFYSREKGNDAKGPKLVVKYCE
jgi:hypothetical protein